LAYAKESTISEAEPTKITYSLPKPSGTYNIGTTELHLVDKDRNDFWTGKPNRELMISIWYPAKENYRGKKAPYMHQESAAITDKNIAQGGHYTFTDHELILPYLDKLIDVPDAVQVDMIGTVNNPERVAGSIRTYINAFFNQHLEKQPLTIFDGNTPKHPDIELVK
jgi:hypothetical protein